MPAGVLFVSTPFFSSPPGRPHGRRIYSGVIGGVGVAVGLWFARHDPGLLRERLSSPLQGDKPPAEALTGSSVRNQRLPGPLSIATFKCAGWAYPSRASVTDGVSRIGLREATTAGPGPPAAVKQLRTFAITSDWERTPSLPSHCLGASNGPQAPLLVGRVSPAIS